MYLARLDDPSGTWTADPILAAHRFTNTYRAADRVSQHLINEIQYAENRSQAPAELLFRTLLFKTFNRIETWNEIESALGPVSWQSADLSAIEAVLDRIHARGATVYSAAYIMPAPPFGRVRKHANHIALIDRMMRDGLAGRIQSAPSLAAVYDMLLSYPGLGRFLAFQYAIDLNYSTICDFDEDEHVVAGPGALDGISKCFSDTAGLNAEDVIRWTSDQQESEFARLGIDFPGLFGRRLRLIDLQNCYCELSKYARVAHPEVAGISGRTKIKQAYRPEGKPLPQPQFPPKWRLAVPQYPDRTPPPAIIRQGELF